MRIISIALALVAFGFVACDDSGTSSTEQNADTEQVSSSSGNTTVEQESSSSVVANDTKQSSSSEKDVETKSSSSNSSIQDYSYGSEEKKTVSSSSLVSFSSSQNEELKYSSSSVTPDESSDSSAFPDGWSWDVPKETYLNPKITYDSIVDPRDGKIYKTVMIGDQVWMAENLNYADSVKTPSLKGKSWCYNNVAANCDVAGRLYTWAAAIDSVKLANDADNPQDCGVDKICTLPAKVQGICPPGWHLPLYKEWQTLFSMARGDSGRLTAKILKSRSGWRDNRNGTDDFGFSTLPAGTGWPGGFADDGIVAKIWSATQYNAANGNDKYVFYMEILFVSKNATEPYGEKDYAHSVRCVKD